MASSSSHPHQNAEPHALFMPSSSSARKRRAFSGFEPPHERRKVSESARLYDVFINHRGPDVKNTLARELYKSLEKSNIRAFLDSEEKVLGDSFLSSIETSIHSATVHIAIFSRRYAESPWCLEELVLMLQTKAKIIPIFYDVEPCALRYIEKGVYGQAFAQYHDKGRYLEKLKGWKEALTSVSFIAGEEFYSSSDCEKTVSAVQKEVERTKPITVAKHPVGLRQLVKDFEKQCIEDFERGCEMNKPGEGKAKIIGIFGMGGVGKTTLSKELFNRKRLDYKRYSFLFDVREAFTKSNLPSLQIKLLRDLFDEDLKSFPGVEDGANCLRHLIRRSDISTNFLIVADDIDRLKQLDDLCITDVFHKFNNCLVIVTTRDERVLINAGISVRYHLKGMHEREAKELFCWHAFRQPNSCSGYNQLVDQFVHVCDGLPLSIQLLGSHVYGIDDREVWKLELEKVKKFVDQDICKSLKISIDSLDKEEKQIFMDVACFFIGELTTMAVRVWEASGWSSQHALRRLKDKCLVEEKTEGMSVLSMHDHLRDLGREMADEESNPCRLWRYDYLHSLESKGFENIINKTKSRCLYSFRDLSLAFDIKFFLGESKITREPSTDLLWLELQYRGGIQILLEPQLPSFKPQPPSLDPNFPPWIPLQNLQCLKVTGMRGLWQSHVQAPILLKELVICRIQDLQELSLGSLGCLEKLEIIECSHLKRVTGISDHTKLAELKITSCWVLKNIRFSKLRCIKLITIFYCGDLEIWTGISDLGMLEELDIVHCDKLEFEESSSCNLYSLKKVGIWGCRNLKNLSRITQDTKLVELKIYNCGKIDELSLGVLHCLEKLVVDNCEHLESVTGLSDLTKLVELNISKCGKIEELSLVKLTHLKECSISDVPVLKRVEVKGCSNLQELRGELWNLVKLDIYDCPRLKIMTEKENLYSLEMLQLCYCSKRTIRQWLNAMKLPSKFIKIIGAAVDGADSALNANLFRGFDSTNSVIHNGMEKTCNHLGRHVVGAIILCSVVRVNSCAAAITMNEFIKECDCSPWLKFEARPGEWIITLVTMREDDIKNYILNKGRCFPFDYLDFPEDASVKAVSMPVMKGEENKFWNILCRIVDELYQS